MDYNFQKLTEWLLYGLIDFDFISESLWKDQTPEEMLTSEGDFLIGKMKYDVIVVPNCVTLRKTTLDRLKAFQAKGGHVIFIGTIPAMWMPCPLKKLPLSRTPVRRLCLQKIPC